MKQGMGRRRIAGLELPSREFPRDSAGYVLGLFLPSYTKDPRGTIKFLSENASGDCGGCPEPDACESHLLEGPTVVLPDSGASHSGSVTPRMRLLLADGAPLRRAPSLTPLSTTVDAQTVYQAGRMEGVLRLDVPPVNLGYDEVIAGAPGTDMGKLDPAAAGEKTLSVPGGGQRDPGADGELPALENKEAGCRSP